MDHLPFIGLPSGTTPEAAIDTLDYGLQVLSRQSGDLVLELDIALKRGASPALREAVEAWAHSKGITIRSFITSKEATSRMRLAATQMRE